MNFVKFPIVNVSFILVLLVLSTQAFALAYDPSDTRSVPTKDCKLKAPKPHYFSEDGKNVLLSSKLSVSMTCGNTNLFDRLLPSSLASILYVKLNSALTESDTININSVYFTDPVEVAAAFYGLNDESFMEAVLNLVESK